MRKFLNDYRQPPLDPAISEALHAHVARRLWLIWSGRLSDRRAADQARLGHQRNQHLYMARNAVAGVAVLSIFLDLCLLGQKRAQGAIRRGHGPHVHKPFQISVAAVFRQSVAGGTNQKAWSAQVFQDGEKVVHGDTPVMWGLVLHNHSGCCGMQIFAERSFQNSLAFRDNYRELFRF